MTAWSGAGASPVRERAGLSREMRPLRDKPGSSGGRATMPERSAPGRGPSLIRVRRVGGPPDLPSKHAARKAGSPYVYADALRGARPSAHIGVHTREREWLPARFGTADICSRRTLSSSDG